MQTIQLARAFEHAPVQDCELLSEDLEHLVKSYKAVVQLELGEEFPNDPKAQLWGAVGAVFNSWMNQRAKTYRCLGLTKGVTVFSSHE